jgi:hypothetical protein
MHRITKVLYSGAIACSIVAGGVVSASANNIGNSEGCTPGYWKATQHHDSWQEYTPGQAAGEVFNDGAKTYTNGLTLLEALQGRGGSGDEGAAEILLRAATASLLNAAHEGVDFPLRRDADTTTDPEASPNGGPALIDSVNAALQSGNRTKMLDLAAELDRLNNLGCPLN